MKKVAVCILVVLMLMAALPVQALACCGPYHDQYISNGDGTHDVFQLCEDCRVDSYYEGQEPCDGDGEETCVYCGAQVEVCHHPRCHIEEAGYTQYSQMVEPYPHHYHARNYKTICNDCGYERTQRDPMDVCSDLDQDLVCDICKGQLHYEHRFHVAAFYQQGADGSHELLYACSSCSFKAKVSQRCIMEDGICTLCGAAAEAKETGPAGGINITLGNTLTVNVLVQAKSLSDGVGTAVFTREGKTPVTVELKPYNDTYYAASYPVAAKEMTDLVRVEVYGEDGSAIVAPIETSVKAYAMTLLRAERSTTALSRVIVDMLNYGTEAQKYFGYRTDSYANADLTADDQMFATTDVDYKNLRQASENCFGTSLSLEDRILLNVYFRTSNAASAQYRYIDYLGKPISGSCSVVDAGKNRVKVTVDTQVLADTKCPVTITVFDKNGEAIAHCEDSVESYIARTEDRGYGELCRSIMKFATSAYDYFGGISWSKDATVFATEAAPDLLLESGFLFPGEACRIGGPVDGYAIFEEAPESYPVIRTGTLRLVGQAEDGENVYLSVGQTEDTYGEDYVCIPCPDYTGDLTENLPSEEAYRTKRAYTMYSSANVPPCYSLESFLLPPWDPFMECPVGAFSGQYWIAPDGAFVVASVDESMDCTSPDHNTPPIG